MNGLFPVDIYDATVVVVGKLKIAHATCEDNWYSCPKSGQCANDLAGDDCDCGADEHNERVATALRLLHSMREACGS